MATEADERTIRSFVALAIDEPMHARIVEVVNDLRSRIRDVRWVSESQIHVTLRFLGEASGAALDRLEQALARASAACSAMDVRFAELGLFPERGNPRVLWLSMALPAELYALQSACESAAVAAGFPPETRPFRPHLTLGRWRTRARRPDLPKIDLGSARLSRMVLFRSDLKPSGAIHTPLRVFALGSVEE